MRRDKILWSAVLIVSLFLLIGYCLWIYTFPKNINFRPYGSGFYGRGMMNRWFDPGVSMVLKAFDLYKHFLPPLLLIWYTCSLKMSIL